MDAFDRRQNLNIEYLKNVFFKYLKSENKQVTCYSFIVVNNMKLN